MLTQRYNIVMVLADQHNASLMGCAGHPQAITPNLDALAASGMMFNRAYCQNPICTPSRTSILSGQYCHNHGYYGLSGPANFGLDNLMRRAKAAGYRTGAWGKLHLPNIPRNWLCDDLDRFGDTYETLNGVIGHSEFLAYLETLGVRDLEDSWHNHSGVYGSRPINHDAMPSKLDYEHTQEVWSAREAMKFAGQDPDTPFCIQIAFQKPHHPLLPQQKFWDMYPENLDLPETVNLEPTGRPPHFRKMYEGYHEQTQEYASPGESFEDGARRVWRGTLACITQIDDVFGRIERDLREMGVADRTIVIYASDHGCYHTIHGLPEKAPGICSEAVCRVPLMVRVPGVTEPGSTSDQLVELIDLAPTLLSLVGATQLDSADGRDISPLLRGVDEPLREAAVTENAWSKAIRWDRWRFVHYVRGTFGSDEQDDEGELYDVIADPNETRNLYRDADHQAIVQQSRRLLLDWLIRTTRLTTRQPTAHLQTESARISGKREYPISTDGRAPRAYQPRWNPPRGANYL